MLNYNIVYGMNGDYWEELMFAFSNYCESHPTMTWDDVTDAMLVDFIKMYCGA